MYDPGILALSVAGLANGLIWYWRNRLRRRRYELEFELYFQSKKEEAQHALKVMERQLTAEAYERRAAAWLKARQGDAELVGGDYQYEASDGIYLRTIQGETYRYRDQDVTTHYPDGGNVWMYNH